MSKKGRYKCPFCSKIYPYSASRSKHLRKFHQLEYNLLLNSRHPCLECFEDCDYGKLYCSLGCRGRAKAIRYIKSVTILGISQRPDIVDAIREKILWAYQGGYVPLPIKYQEIIWERDQGICQICYGSGELIDHEQGTLEGQCLCISCHDKKTRDNRVLSTDPYYLAYVAEIWEDVGNSLAPHHLPNWDYVSERNRRKYDIETFNKVD